MSPEERLRAKCERCQRTLEAMTMVALALGVALAVTVWWRAC